MIPIILAGGMGTRLANYPKAFIPFETRKLIELQLVALKKANMQKPVVVWGEGGEEIASVVGNSAITVFSSIEHGARGALYQGLKYVGDQDVVVLYGDILISPEYVSLFKGQDWAIGVYSDNRIPVRLVDGMVRRMGDVVSKYGFAGIMSMSSIWVPLMINALEIIAGTEIYPAVNMLLRKSGALPIWAGGHIVIDVDNTQDSLRAHDVYALNKDKWGVVS